MISSIRDRSVARTACGTFAGINTTDCGVVCTSRPPIVRTRAPDSVRTSASNGAVCSDNSSPASKANRVMLPAAVRASTRLAIPCAVGVTKASNAKSSPGRKRARHCVLLPDPARTFDPAQVGSLQVETPAHAGHEPTLWKPGLPSWNPSCVAANPIPQLRLSAPGNDDNLLCDVTRVAAS